MSNKYVTWCNFIWYKFNIFNKEGLVIENYDVNKPNPEVVLQTIFDVVNGNCNNDNGDNDDDDDEDDD